MKPNWHEWLLRFFVWLQTIFELQTLALATLRTCQIILTRMSRFLYVNFFFLIKWDRNLLNQQEKRAEKPKQIKGAISALHRNTIVQYIYYIVYLLETQERAHPHSSIIIMQPNSMPRVDSAYNCIRLWCRWFRSSCLVLRVCGGASSAPVAPTTTPSATSSASFLPPDQK